MVDGNDNSETVLKPLIRHKKPAVTPHMRTNQNQSLAKNSDQTSHVTRHDFSATAANNVNNNQSLDSQWMDRTPCGSATPSPHIDESYETPPCIRWGLDFQYLIGDEEGKKVFEKYLRSEGMYELLRFYYACEGFKEMKAEKKDKLKLANIIWKIAVKNSKIIALSDQVLNSLKQKLMSLNAASSQPDEFECDMLMFVEAQLEVEEELKGAIYQNFTRSEIYIKHCQDNSHQYSSGAAGGFDPKTALRDSPKTNDRSISQMDTSPGDYHPGNTQNNLLYDVLPTVHEDSELQTTNPSSVARQSTPSNVNIRSHPQNKFQTLSDDNCHNLMSSGSSETLMRGINKIMSQRSATTSARIITESHPLSPNLSNRLQSAHQSYFRSKAMSNPPNPYHVKYSTVLPTSAQDSEIQSISSHSTNDSAFSLSESDGNNNSGVRSKQQMNRLMKNNARLNANQANPLRVNTFTMPLKPQKTHPPNANDAANPEKFAIDLIQRLEKVRQQQESLEKNDKKLQEMLQLASGSNQDKASVSARPPSANPSECSSTSLLRERLKERPVFDLCMEEVDESQAILDMHCAQVFKTPNETPTDSIGRSISSPRHPNYRPYEHRMIPAVPSQHTASTSNPSLEPKVRVVLKYSNEKTPYLLFIRGHQITLRKFKQHVPVKPGNWQFYFKRKCDDQDLRDIGEFVMEKISDDNACLPIVNGDISAELQESN